jgi:hypothetical protein
MVCSKATACLLCYILFILMCVESFTAECASANGGCSTTPPVQCTNTIGNRTCGTSARFPMRSVVVVLIGLVRDVYRCVSDRLHGRWHHLCGYQ